MGYVLSSLNHCQSYVNKDLETESQILLAPCISISKYNGTKTIQQTFKLHRELKLQCNYDLNQRLKKEKNKANHVSI